MDDATTQTPPAEPGEQEQEQERRSGEDRRAPAGDQTYQVYAHVGGDEWRYVGQVTVPPRTTRRTVIRRLFDEHPETAPSKDAQGQTSYMVLDAASSEAIPVGWDVPAEPELRIG